VHNNIISIKIQLVLLTFHCKSVTVPCHNKFIGDILSICQVNRLYWFLCN